MIFYFRSRSFLEADILQMMEAQPSEYFWVSWVVSDRGNHELLEMPGGLIPLEYPDGEKQSNKCCMLMQHQILSGLPSRTYARSIQTGKN